MSEHLKTVGDRHVLRIERELAHPIEKVWRALTEPDELGKWFPGKVAVDLRPGGKLTFDQDGEIETGSVLELEPPRVFAFSWGEAGVGDILRFELVKRDSGCLLIFDHTFGVRSAAASYASGWTVCFDAMEQVLSDEPVKAEAEMNELHEHFVAKLGLTEGVATSADGGGWEVRFDRQLTQPAERVWEALIGSPTDTAPNSGETVPAGFATYTVSGGTVTTAKAPTLLEYRWTNDEGRDGVVRWELTEGTGHGARLLLSQSGLAENEIDRALSAWRDRIESLASKLAAAPRR